MVIEKRERKRHADNRKDAFCIRRNDETDSISGHPTPAKSFKISFIVFHTYMTQILKSVKGGSVHN